MKVKIGRNLWFAVIVLLLLGAVAYLCTLLRRANVQIDGLKRDVISLNSSKEDVYITERISKQMEDIAYQQKAVSDDQREEAKRQTDIAVEMRLRAELEQLNAQEAAAEADKARVVAEDQRNVAERQTEEARLQQRVAELARSKADTLSHILLGRSLAINSNNYYASGNKQIANYLIYAAYDYLTRYGASPYSSIMYSGLIRSSETLKSYHIHQGGVTCIVPVSEKQGNYVSVSKLGEINRWYLANGQLQNKGILRDKRYSFRDACAVGGKVFVLSFDGMLLAVEGDRIVSSLQLTTGGEKGFFRLVALSGNALAAFTKDKMYVVNVHHEVKERVVPIAGGVLAIGGQMGGWHLLTKNGKMMTISGGGVLQPESLALQDKNVTAMAFDKKYRIWAVGTSDGQVLVLDAKGKMVRRVNAHKSAITHLEFYDSFLISSSMDRTINKIDLVDNDQETVSLCTMSSWVYDFCVDGDGNLWIADEGGNVSFVLTRPEQLAGIIKSHIKRDLTKEEWKSYVGSNVPYRKLVFQNE